MDPSLKIYMCRETGQIVNTCIYTLIYRQVLVGMCVSKPLKTVKDTKRGKKSVAREDVGRQNDMVDMEGQGD